MEDLWDETSGLLADMLGKAGLINEAVPHGAFPRTIYTRSGDAWTILTVQERRGVDVLTMGAGIVADATATQGLHVDLNARSLKAPGSFHAVIPYSSKTCGIVFKALVPLVPLFEPHGPMTSFARGLVSATLGLAAEVGEELRAAHGGVPFAFEHRGLLGQLC